MTVKKMAFPRIIIVGLVIVWILLTSVSATTVENSFAYSKTITIQGSPAGAQNNYPVKLVLFNTTTPGASREIVLDPPGAASPSWNDVRFSGVNNIHFLYPYWIESTNETSATIWVDIPEIPTKGVDISIHYGNPYALDAQDGDATFSLFDNFDGTFLNSGRWTNTPGVKVSNGKATITASSDDHYYLSSIARFGTGYRIVTRIRPHNVGDTGTLENFFASYNDFATMDTALYSQIYPQFTGRYYNDNGKAVGSGTTGKEITGIFPDMWNRHEAIKNETAITWIANSGAPYTLASDYYSGPGSVRFTTYHAGTLDVDWVFVGKYVFPEPSVAVPVNGYPDMSIPVPESNPLARQPLQLFMANHGGLMDPTGVFWFPESGPGDIIYRFRDFDDEPSLVLHNINDTSYEVWFFYTPVGLASGDNVASSTGFYYNGTFVANNPAGYYSGSGRWPGSMKYAATIMYTKQSAANDYGISDENGVTVNKNISPRSIKTGTDSSVSLTISNKGQYPIHDIEISDTVPSEFYVTVGKTQFAIPGIIEPGETQTFSYIVTPRKAGRFILDSAKTMYADKSGNYFKTTSNMAVVEVIEPLIQPSTNPLQDLISAFRSWFP